jgi:hypothetical protein
MFLVVIVLPLTAMFEILLLAYSSQFVFVTNMHRHKIPENAPSAVMNFKTKPQFHYHDSNFKENNAQMLIILLYHSSITA